MAPGGRTLGLPHGRLLGCMKAALLASCMGGRWEGGGGGGGVVTHPLSIQTRERGRKAKRKKVGEEVCGSVARRKGKGRREKKERKERKERK